MTAGVNLGPRQAKFGLDTGVGFKIGDRVRVTKDRHFQDWHGVVINHDGSMLAVELNEPPPGEQPNGQWFNAENLELAPR